MTKNRLFRAMEAAGLKPTQVTKLTGWHHQHVLDLLTGDCAPSRGELERFAELFQVDHGWLKGERTELPQEWIDKTENLNEGDREKLRELLLMVGAEQAMEPACQYAHAGEHVFRCSKCGVKEQ